MPDAVGSVTVEEDINDYIFLTIESGLIGGIPMVINDINSKEDEIHQVVSGITGRNKEAIGIVADITEPQEAFQMVEEIAKNLGSIDILVNNAGIKLNGLMQKGNLQNWESVLFVHLTGSFNCTRAVLKLMLEQSYGRIINISSVVGLTGIKGTPYYATAKAGLLGLTKATAVEVAHEGITYC